MATAQRSSTVPSGWRRSGASGDNRAGARQRIRLGIEHSKFALQPLEDRQIDLAIRTGHNHRHIMQRSLDARTCDRLGDVGRHDENLCVAILAKYYEIAPAI